MPKLAHLYIATKGRKEFEKTLTQRLPPYSNLKQYVKLQRYGLFFALDSARRSSALHVISLPSNKKRAGSF